LGLQALALLATAALPPLLGACSQTPVTVDLHSLQASGNVSFVCRGDDNSPSGHQLNECPDYEHITRRMLGLVTQTATDEVAIVDLVAGAVVDVDPTTPGYSFLRVGARPGAIDRRLAAIGAGDAARRVLAVAVERAVVDPAGGDREAERDAEADRAGAAEPTGDDDPRPAPPRRDRLVVWRLGRRVERRDLDHDDLAGHRVQRGPECRLAGHRGDQLDAAWLDEIAELGRRCDRAIAELDGEPPGAWIAHADQHGREPGAQRIGALAGEPSPALDML